MTPDEVLQLANTMRRLEEAGPKIAYIFMAKNTGDYLLRRTTIAGVPTGAGATQPPPRLTLHGVPIIYDNLMPDLAWRVMDRDGNELVRGSYPTDGTPPIRIIPIDEEEQT